jgi:glycosyltransferase involved in cell wall biosynthesis
MGQQEKVRFLNDGWKHRSVLVAGATMDYQRRSTNSRNDGGHEIEVSVVMPCLNEEQTIGACVEKAMQALERMEVLGEVVVADNGSTDHSVPIAEALGARVVHQLEKGYGNAYMKGIAEARGRYIVIGDSDNTYDFSEIERFVGPLRDGYDVVMGNRFKGRILPGAMPWHHQYIGNPILSGILNLFFRTSIGDAHCGMRSFQKEAWAKMRLQTSGMEFASEMVINASMAGLRITEVPITYYSRAEGAESKLNSFRDGWRHLRFMLLYSPTWLFMVPGFTLLSIGFLLLTVLALFGPIRIGINRFLYFDLHYMVLGSLMSLLGFQVINLGIYAKVYSLTEHFEKRDPLVEWILKHFNLERGTILGAIIFLIGLLTNFVILYQWITIGFGNQPRLREAILAMTLMVIGAQTIFSSFFLSILGIRTRGS